MLPCLPFGLSWDRAKQGPAQKDKGFLFPLSPSPAARLPSPGPPPRLRIRGSFSGGDPRFCLQGLGQFLAQQPEFCPSLADPRGKLFHSEGTVPGCSGWGAHRAALRTCPSPLRDHWVHLSGVLPRPPTATGPASQIQPPPYASPQRTQRVEPSPLRPSGSRRRGTRPGESPKMSSGTKVQPAMLGASGLSTKVLGHGGRFPQPKSMTHSRPALGHPGDQSPRSRVPGLGELCRLCRVAWPP